jgi:hypothetical protein
MTAVTDAKLIIETALGHTLTGDALTRIADAYTQADPHNLSITLFADPENPTNEEKAQLYIDTLITNGKQVVGIVSDLNSDEAAAATKAANRATAEADFE